MKLFQLGKGVCNYYRTKVKGNEETPNGTIQRKLTRNIAMSIKVSYNENKVIYLYGQLHIYTEGNTITKIVNINMNADWFYKNMKEKKRLDKVLGIHKKAKKVSQWKEVGDLSYIDEYEKGFEKELAV
jgi:hypothetical protein